MARVRIRNWEKFQHFRDRKPPWIKVYRDLLDDLQWHKLDPLHAKVLIMLWLIASEDDGYLPDMETLAFRLRVGTVEHVEQLVIGLSHWLVHDDITAISPRHQHDALETETETEGETEAEARARPQPKPKAAAKKLIAGPKYSEAFEAFWQAYPTDKRGMSKLKASASFERLTAADKAAALEALPAYTRKLDSKPNGRDFVQHAATYLNQRTWESFLAIAEAPPKSITGAGTVMLPDGRIRSSRYPRSEAAWRELVATWATARTWPDYAGPDPGSSLCECPRDLLTPPAQITPAPIASRPNGNGAHQDDGGVNPDRDYDHTSTPMRGSRKPPSPDEQRVLLDGYLSGTLALDGPAPGRPGSLISPEIARERGL